MAFIFYCVINVTATNMVITHMIDGEPNLLNKITVCESMLLWPDPVIAISLATIFFLLALLNIVFTSFIAYEQITMFYQELRHKEESMRVERFLKIKDRPLNGLSFVEQRELKVEFTRSNKVTPRGRMLIIVILLLSNTAISMVPPYANSIILNLVGAFTAPLVMFMLPGYLFYDHSCRLEV